MSEIDIEKENKAIAQQYKQLLKISYQTLTDDDKKLIRKAFDVAVDAHKDQRRKSGEAYIFHPIAVARIVASEIGLDATSIAAALLHDVVEDTDYTVEDMREMFGDSVAKIVDGLTKIANMPLDTDISMQAENFRRMLLTLSEDIRVIIIKIADRLHNMQTMESMPRYKQEKIASETLYIYAPLAHRIGMYNIKSELEDLGLKYTEPDIYQQILDQVKESKEEQDAYINDFTKTIKESLDVEKIDYSIKGRPKSIFSIRKKMRVQNITYNEVYDKFAIRIVYNCEPNEEKFLAWKIYSIVTDHFRPNPTRLRDWISAPKSTGYEALHITVMGPKGRWVEVQIRSHRMNEIAEKGYAAHYKYKNKEEKEDRGLDIWLNKLQESLENPELNAVDFVEEFKLNLYAKEIFVFTPKGDLYSLPKGATALDFGFQIHTEIGLKTRGARVNGKLVPLSHVLKSGDQVEIITSKKANPSANWLDYVTTGKARNKIRASLREERREIAAEGKEALTRKLRSLRINLDERTTNEMVNFFKLKTSQDLYYRVGAGIIENKELKDYSASRNNALFNFFKNRVRKSAPTPVPHQEVTEKLDQLVFGKDEERLDYVMANCCHPLPGDDVFGFLTVSEGIKVHRKDCPNALQLHSNYAYRILQAKWIDSTQHDFKATLEITGIDLFGLVNQVTKVISKYHNINMRSVNFDSYDGIFQGKIALTVRNKLTLDKLIQDIKKINGIDKVTRT